LAHPVRSSRHTSVSTNHTAGRANRTNKSFIRTAEGVSRTGKPSSRTVFPQKHAESGKNRAFSPSTHTRWSKNDGLPTGAGKLFLVKTTK